MTRALVLWALLCGAAQAQIGPSLGSPTGPGIGSAFQSAAGLPDDTPWWKSGPLITPDGNRVAHVIWRNGALVDLAGNSWTQNGTVPQVAASGFIPPGAGQFSAANNYTLGAGSDVLDFAGGTFTIVVIGRLSSLPGASAESLDNSTPVATGYRTLITPAGLAQTAFHNAGSVGVTTANATSAGSVYVSCHGLSGNATGFTKLNLGAIVSGAASMASPAGDVARIGYEDGLGRAYPGVLYEVYATTTVPSDGLCTSIATQVAARLKVTL